ncbi:cytochrome P450 [Achromobacter sp. GD03932]|uniref:cytochrome P450 n=1 Tax=Achromobacter sp. GD03932 TaxID=2975407 RepID=UPI00244C9BE2|nr:cytochrome P450 [Achromobacter sp. GD03932]MDH1301382.1 cytochrome P450 [Achromobacter sp. GD03932]
MNHTDFDLPGHVSKVLVDAQVYADIDELHATYTWARANNPLGRAINDGFDPFWVVTKHADVSTISRDTQTFRNGDYAIICSPKATIQQLVAVSGSHNGGIRSLVHVDGEEHKGLRSLTQAWFMPNSILKLDERIRDLAARTVDKLAAADGEVIDFATEIALHYPLHVIMDILGVPPEDESRMLLLTQELFGSEDPELKRAGQARASDPEALAKYTLAIVADFRAYFEKVTADRRANPRNDVATLLANAVIDGVPISEDSRLGYYVIIATAGHDTTSSSTAVAMWALGQYPELLPRLQANPGLIPQFIDEAVRMASPVRHFMRTAVADTEIRGRQIRKGDWLMLCYGSANRDEEAFENPFAFDIDRKPNRHLAFGLGTHICLGQHLAKMEMRLLFEEMIPRLQRVELAGEMTMSASRFVGGPKHLPVRCFMN